PDAPAANVSTGGFLQASQSKPAAFDAAHSLGPLLQIPQAQNGREGYLPDLTRGVWVCASTLNREKRAALGFSPRGALAPPATPANQRDLHEVGPGAGD
ncbi:MAG: hypothetical protein Q8N47_09800, partial [Bryobacterales bacterium]|nr:hypothetical protein [Bryobacterales bacterium]